MQNIDFGVDQLITMIARLRGMLVNDGVAAAAVEGLAQVARDLVVSSVGAGASLMDDTGRRVSTATTDLVAATADAWQYEFGQGPCMSAWATTSVQRLDDTASDQRWPTWSAAAREVGIRSVLSAPLMFRGGCIGALKVYSTSASAFTPDDERRLVLLSDSAATLLGMAVPDGPQQLTETLVRALADRKVVETATGMLMERHQIGDEEAFYRLLDQSAGSRRPLAAVARAVIAPSSESAR